MGDQDSALGAKAANNTNTKARLLAAVKNGDSKVTFGPNVHCLCVPTGDFYRVEVSGDQPEGFKWDEEAGLSYWEGALIDDAVTKIAAALAGAPVKGEEKEIGEGKEIEIDVTDFVGITKPYDKVSDAPENIQELDDAKLTLAQVNWIANQADGLKGKEGIDSPWAVAIGNFKRLNKKEGDKWVAKKEVSLDASLQQVRDAFYAEFRPPVDAAVDHIDFYVKEVYPTFVVAESEGKIYRIAYVKTLEGIQFDPRDKWQQVEISYVLVKELSRSAEEQRIRDAFLQKFGPSDAVPIEDFYVREVFEDHLIAGFKGGLYKFPFAQRTSGKIDFPFGEWEEVEMTYAPVRAAPAEDLPFTKELAGKEPVMKMAVAVAKAMLKRQKSVATVWKEGDDRYYMALISMAIYDEENQIVEKEGMDSSIALAQKFGYKSGLYIRHVVPESLVGRCMYERRIGPYWVEVGKFKESPLADATFDILEKDEDGTWKLSIGFITTKDQAKRGRYTRLLKYDTTITDRPALPVTALLAVGGKTEMKDMAKLLTFLNPQTEEEKEKYAGMLGDLFEVEEKELATVVKEVEQMEALKKALDEAGIEDEDVRAKIIAAVDEEEPPADEPPADDAPPVDLSQQIQDAVTAAMAPLGERLTALEEQPGAAEAVKEIGDLLKKRSQDLPRPSDTAPVVEGVSDLVDKIDKHIGDTPSPKHPLAGFAGGPAPIEGG